MQSWAEMTQPDFGKLGLSDEQKKSSNNVDGPKVAKFLVG